MLTAYKAVKHNVQNTIYEKNEVKYIHNERETETLTEVKKRMMDGSLLNTISNHISIIGLIEL